MVCFGWAHSTFWDGMGSSDRLSFSAAFICLCLFLIFWVVGCGGYVCLGKNCQCVSLFKLLFGLRGEI